MDSVIVDELTTAILYALQFLWMDSNQYACAEVAVLGALQFLWMDSHPLPLQETELGEDDLQFLWMDSSLIELADDSLLLELAVPLDGF